VTFIVMKNKAP